MAKRCYPKQESLEKIIENAICYNCAAIPGPNGNDRKRYNCVDYSNTLCETCKAKCKCGSSVGKCPNPIFHQVLEELPVPWFCPHYKNGCREKLPVEGIDEHQKNCIFRMVNCPENYSKCKQKVFATSHFVMRTEPGQFLQNSMNDWTWTFSN